MTRECCRLRTIATSGALIAGLALSGTADAAEKFVYGLSWLPQAEHCGFFQAKAHGLYEAVGLEYEAETKPKRPRRKSTAIEFKA